MPTTTDFTAFYDPNLRTSLSFNGPGVEYGSGSGLGFNIDDMMAKAFAYKQKGNEEDWYWKQRQAQENARMQAEALKDAQRMRYEEEMRADRRGDPLWQNKERLDEMNRWNPAFAHGAGLLGTNDKFLNLPAAAAITYGKDPFDKGGWDMYKAAAGTPSATAIGEANANLRQQRAIASGTPTPRT